MNSSVWHDEFISVTWWIHQCDMMNSSVWHDEFISVTWWILFRRCCTLCVQHRRKRKETCFTCKSSQLIHQCDMKLIHQCDMNARVTKVLCYTWNRSLFSFYMTQVSFTQYTYLFLHMTQVSLYMTQVSFTHDTHLFWSVAYVVSTHNAHPLLHVTQVSFWISHRSLLHIS